MNGSLTHKPSIKKNLSRLSPKGFLPAVSIILPIYRSKLFIPELVTNLWGQSFQDWEAIVVDDGSNDGSLELFQSCAQADSRFAFFLKKPEGLPAKSRNHALAQARGTWFAFLDADDLWHPQKLHHQVAGMRQFPKSLLSYTKVLSFDEQPPAFADLGTVPYVEHFAFRSLVFRNFLTTSGIMVHKSVLKRFGFFPEQAELRIAEDYFYWLKLAEQAPFLKIDAPLCLYRFHPHNISADRTQLAVGLRQIAKYWQSQAPFSLAANALRLQAAKTALGVKLRKLIG